MADDQSGFSIDDALSVSENLTSFKAILKTLDAPLATALGGHLAGLAAGQAPDKATLWTTLYEKADAPTSPETDPTNDLGGVI